MITLVDDIGSFPFPSGANEEEFFKAYQIARQAAINKKDLTKDPFLQQNFNPVILGAFKKKLASGLDCVNYPWIYDGLKQVTDQIHVAMEKGSFVVEETNAVFPEVCLINQEAKKLTEEFGKKINLRIAIYGPMELYINELGTKVHADVLEGFVETVKRFAKNSIINNKYLQTTVISIDEPSFGFNNLLTDPSFLCSVLEKTFNFKGATKQIHLHSASNLHDLLNVKNIDVLSFEYAASPRNIEAVSKKMLDSADKQIRVGISRTDIDTIIAEQNEKGITQPAIEQLIENEETIRKRFRIAKEKYGDRLSFTGPDCGLSGWPSQEAAQALLKRTVKAVQAVQSVTN